MKHLKRITAAALCATLLCGCTAAPPADTSGDNTEGSALATLAAGQFDPEYSERDLDGSWDESAATKIVFSGASAEIDGSGAAFAEDALSITADGVYALSGVLDDGQVIVSAPETAKVQLVLNSVAISCSDSAAINITQADKVFITLAEGTTNTLTDGASYSLAQGSDEPDACIFSKSDLTINGAGALSVSGNYNHGVHGKDDLKITGGDITVTAVNDALKGRDCVAVCGGSLKLNHGHRHAVLGSLKRRRCGLRQQKGS